MALLGIDIGSSAIKVAAFDATGRALAQASRALPSVVSEQGTVERDPDLCWALTCAAIRDVVDALPTQPILGIGVTGCGNGAVFLDKEGNAIAPGILAMDRRARKYVDAEALPRMQAYPGQLKWLLQWYDDLHDGHRPALGSALFWKDYVRLRLTDGLATDFTDAGAGGLLDEDGCAPDAPHRAVPPIKSSLETAGYVTARASAQTGLKAGIPVAVGCVDFEAAAIGCGLQPAHEVSIVAGSWSINQSYSDRPARTGEIFLSNPSVFADRWLLLDGSPNSASHFDWMIRAVRRSNDFAHAAEQAARHGPGNVIFVPGLFEGGARFSGLQASDSIDTMTFAVMEGVAFAHRHHIDRLRDAGVAPLRARLTGGASYSPLWSQLFADILGLPVLVSQTSDIGALGAAMIAAVASGIYDDLPVAQAVMTANFAAFHPFGEYEQRYARYVRELERAA
ncbi:FGGY-family carbohydrate kinase [Sphingobium algorifonticola]|uniref:Carbohydrate kinase n=1 Tax=Sphingobium algorifonticola TaxID=2008318 RepID=A0A437JCI4_9SPHN|nr:FGGY family carbohydrate kinase [Sphingobium algorifonticola]RVT43463.1 hypothetical protein ENE74_02210 [Sphingobium algorifonticola]